MLKYFFYIIVIILTLSLFEVQILIEDTCVKYLEEECEEKILVLYCKLKVRANINLCCWK